MNNTDIDIISIIELTLESYHLYKKALMNFKQGEFQKEKQFYKQGDRVLLKVSRIHAKMLAENVKVDLLLVYAEDLLVSVQLYKSLMKEFEELYIRFPTLKGN